jgi:hypothetical protein
VHAGFANSRHWMLEVVDVADLCKHVATPNQTNQLTIRYNTGIHLMFNMHETTYDTRFI